LSIRYFRMQQVRSEEQLETALCIRRIDPTFRTYCVVASNQFGTSTVPVAIHRGMYYSMFVHKTCNEIIVV